MGALEFFWEILVLLFRDPEAAAREHWFTLLLLTAGLIGSLYSGAILGRAAKIYWKWFVEAVRDHIARTSDALAMCAIETTVRVASAPIRLVRAAAGDDWRRHADPNPGGEEWVLKTRIEVRTAYLVIEQGGRGGRVLQGDFAGVRLEDLSDWDVAALRGECETADPQSVPVLDRYFPLPCGRNDK